MNDLELWRLRNAVAAVKQTAPADPDALGELAYLETAMARLMDIQQRGKDEDDAQQ